MVRLHRGVADGRGTTAERHRKLGSMPAHRVVMARAARSTAAEHALLRGTDLELLREAAQLSSSAAGSTAPHPNAACLLVGPDGRRLASTYLRASGAPSPEVQAVRLVQGAAAGATAYLNLESGDCHGEDAAVQALIQAGVSRVVLGLRHPLPHARGGAVKAWRDAGMTVDVLGEARCEEGLEAAAAAQTVMLQANEALLHRAARRRPFSILKYAMTLDGKIATQQGHSAWVTSPPARAMVFDARGRSDAVIVGGNTVRRDNPRLTTRKEGGHSPVRIVMSRTLDLPEDAALWDVSVAPTIVATQRGARSLFQAKLRDQGVEVIEFDFLTPEAVADYCYSRGFLQCFWECGGTLAAPCIASSVVHKVMAFVAPKVIGGARAPTPVGELGFVEMTQALTVADVAWQQVGPDLLLTGYLPASGGVHALASELEQATAELDPVRARTAAVAAAAAAVAITSSSKAAASSSSSRSVGESAAQAGSVGVLTQLGTDVTSNTATATATTSSSVSPSPSSSTSRSSGWQTTADSRYSVVPFYKAWDKWGALSNFSPHAIQLPHYAAPEGSAAAQQLLADQQALAAVGIGGAGGAAPPPPQPGSPALTATASRQWATVEHFYQAQKFSGCSRPEAAALIEAIAAAGSPEEAARIGRRAERATPHLLTPGWSSVKVAVMLCALRAKFTVHAGPRAMLLATSSPPGPPARLVEASPNDFYWGAGYTGNGQNVLGKLLALVRKELGAAN